jgi:SAM-dependent methyltransferase
MPWKNGRGTTLEIASDNKSRGVDYQPTRRRAFLKLMDQLRLPPGSVFVDLGCGKGRILLLASRFGFRRIVGVEFSPALAEVARKNVEAFRRARPAAPEIRVVTSDVVDYTIQDDENCLFLFNPFDAVVLQRLLRNVQLSLSRAPRPVWLVYHKPVWRTVIEDTRLFEVVQEYRYGSSEFVIYRHPSPVSGP